MDLEKIGEFISKLRKEKTISQDELAEMMHMDRSNISRWENGRSQIPTDKLKTLGDIFDVTIDELLSGERQTTKNKKAHNEIIYTFIKEKDSSISKLKRNIAILLIMLIFTLLSFLVYYFFETYNTERIYKVTGESENYKLLNGILFVTREESYLKIGGINSNIEEIELYYKEKDKIEKIYTGNSDNIIVDFTGYDSGINIKIIDNVKENLYLKINNEEIKLVLSEQYKNDNYLLKNYKSSRGKEFVKTKSKIPKKIKEEFDCNDIQCTLLKDILNIVYDIDAKVFIISDEINEVSINYNINMEQFYYDSKDLSYIIEKGKLTCNSLSCENYEESYEKYYINLIKEYIK